MRRRQRYRVDLHRQPKHGGLLAASVLAAWLPLAGCSASGPGAIGAGASVVLVSVDTLRADRLGLYGYERPTSPHLEELARDGVVFDSFVTNGGATLPSHMTMMTSLHPSAHGVLPETGRVLEPGVATLADRLRQAGYATAAFTDSGWVKGRFGFAQGFDLFDDGGGRLAAILPKALDWLRRNRDRRFFLFLHTYDVHSQGQGLTYSCPGEFPHRYATPPASGFDGCRDGVCGSLLLQRWNQRILAGEITIREALPPEELEYLQALYDGCINYVDERIGQLRETLVELGLYDPALVIVTSDHGEEFGEHGLFLHGQVYEEQAHVPLVLKLPFSRAAGTRVSHLAAMADLMPTILEIVGLPPAGGVQGHSLLPAIFAGEPIRSATHLAAGKPGAVRTPSWKYFEEPPQLYDLAADPGETVNLIEARPELAQRLGRYLEAQLARDRALLATGDEPPVELLPEEIRELEALGYLQ